METYQFILIIVGILALLSIFYIVVYNKIRHYQSKIEKVEGMIDQDLRSKYDLLMEANKNIQNILNSKKDYFKELESITSSTISNFDMERKLKDAEIILKSIFEDNKDISDNNKINEILYQLKTTNEKLAAGVSYYNHYMNERNDYIRKFPNLIVAKIHHINEKPFFDQKDMTDDILDDMKF